jgi:hypothetical protein
VCWLLACLLKTFSKAGEIDYCSVLVLFVAFKFFFLTIYRTPNLGQLWPEFEKYFGGKKKLE